MPLAKKRTGLRQGLRKIAIYGATICFVLWCVIAFWRDISRIDLRPVALHWPLITIAAALSLLNYALRALRWRWYLKILGQHYSWGFIGLTYLAGFAFTLSPGKLGEVVRARYYAARGLKVSAVASAFFAERLLDLAAIVLLALAAISQVKAYQPFLWSAMLLVGASLVVVATWPWSRTAHRLEQRRAQGHVFPGQHQLIAFSTVIGSSRRFLSAPLMVGGLLLGIVAWGAEAVGFFLLSNLSDGNLALTASLGVYGISIIVGALSFLPGGLGSTEAVMTALLVSHGYEISQAILITIVCRLLTLWLGVAIGWLCVGILRYKGEISNHG